MEPLPKIDPKLVSVFKAQLSKLVAEAGGIKALADRCGITPGSIHHYLKGDGDPGRRVILALCRGALVTPDWLLLGAENTTPQDNAPIPDDGLVKIPELVRHQEGQTTVLRERPGPIALNRKWLEEEIHCKSSSLFWLEAKDADMEPLIHVGELMLIDRSITFLVEDGIYLIRRAGFNFTVKEVQSHGHNTIQVRGSSRGYVNWNVEQNQWNENFEILARVILSITRR